MTKAGDVGRGTKVVGNWGNVMDLENGGFKEDGKHQFENFFGLGLMAS